MLKKSTFTLVLLVFSALFLPSLGIANDAQYSDFKISSGRHVFFKKFAGSTDKANLILLPGLNRALPENYAGISFLQKMGYGVLLTATSSHWQSLQNLEKDERPYFEQKSDLQGLDFAFEVEKLLDFKKIQKPILVSLSFSSAIAAYSDLRKIYVAPLVKSSDSNPEGAQAAAAWEATLALNIFFDPSLIRQFRDYNLKTYWSPIVDGNLKINPEAYGKNITRERVINSYLSISRSVEDFDLSTIEFKKDIPVQFILGTRESSIRLKGQLAAALNAAKVAPVQIVLVKEALHNVPETQPQAYATALDYLVQHFSNSNFEVGYIDPSATLETKKVVWLNAIQTTQLIERISQLPDSTDSADIDSLLP